MFRKYYKAANDDIKPSYELIDAVFEKATSEKEQPAKVYKFVTRYGTAVAAVLVLAISTLIFPRIIETTEAPNSISNTNLGEAENTEIKGFERSTSQEPAVFKEEDAKLISESNQEVYNNEKLAEHTSSPSQTTAEQEVLIPQDVESAVTSRMIIKNEVCEISVDDINAVTEEEIKRATEFLKSEFGEKDTETEREYIFEIAGKAENFYIGRWRWLLDGHSSLITEFVLNQELTKMYEFQYTETDTIKWDIEKNLIQ